MNTDDLNNLSEQLLLHVKMKKDTSILQSQLADKSVDFLYQNLKGDDKKKAFWINIYNAYYQILRIEKKVVKPEIYKKKLFVIANTSMSLDDVEHGILRRWRYKYSFGYFSKFWTPRFIKRNAVDVLDYRIHFALNCGAKSCPPIAFYKSDKIDVLLDMATQSFLEGESDFDDENKIVHTTSLFKWFHADFGGAEGIKKIYLEQLKKDISEYKISYKEYSWEDDLDNFVS